MFYSQFILAKKGPLGTIWIAAHLERKLRKNQVADTDIGVSVDSILFPDVPIALRLSSHLLLGVVRIYSRKVNYLFDDCSEALLKIKQAFRSTAVDLPPEESTAPYHSITLPETFDLDDFELPDNEIFQGNYVDHHVSTREQITLQDTMEGVVYSTSQFGLDERFGDGDTSHIGLDLDEDLFLDKVAGPGRDGVALSMDVQAFVQPATPLKIDEINEGTTETSDAMLDDGNRNQMQGLAASTDFADAPATPGLVGEPVLTNVKEALGCDDNLVSVDHNSAGLAVEENLENAISDSDRHLENRNVCNDTIPDDVSCTPAEENCSVFGQQEFKQVKPQEGSPHPVEKDGVRSNNETNVLLTDLAHIEVEGSQAADLGETFASSVDDYEASLMPCSDTEITHRKSDPSGTFLSVLEDLEFGVAHTSYMESDAAELKETQTEACEESKDFENVNPAAPEELSSSGMHMLQPCSSHLKEPNMFSQGDEVSVKVPDLPSKVDGHCSLEAVHEDFTNSSVLPEVPGEGCQVADVTIQNLEANLKLDRSSCEYIQAGRSKLDEQLDNGLAGDTQFENLDKSANPDLPAPEKFLSVPESTANLANNLLVESTADKEVQMEDERDGTSILGKKRSLAESSLTLETHNSEESSYFHRSKRTAESIPDDDDLLSSILAGRRSSVLKIKSTPPPEVAPMKSLRSGPRVGTSKRKVLMDDSMILHGDTIRQQLTSTEDIRRIRKKAPCTRPEIWMIQKQFLDDDIFSEPIFTGMSIELIFLHSRVHDLTGINISHRNGNNASVEDTKVMDVPMGLDVTEEAEGDGNVEASIVSTDNKVAPVETSFQDENQQHEEHFDDAYVQVKASIDAPELEAFQSEALHEIEINRASIAAPDTADHGVEFASRTVPLKGDVCNMTADSDFQSTVSEKTSGVDALLQVEALCLSPDIKLDEQSIDKTSIVDTNGNRIGGFESEFTSRGELLLDETEGGRSVEDGAFVHVDCCESASNADSSLATLRHGTGENGPSGVTDDLPKENEKDEPGIISDNIFLDGELNFDYKEQAFSNSNVEEPKLDTSYSLELGVDMKYASMDDGENPSFMEAGPQKVIDVENMEFDHPAVEDHGDFENITVAHDTEFLNVDDDDAVEDDDNYMPSAEEAQFTENSGWSSRTRAVAKYLQTLFDREAENGKVVLPMDKLLLGKTRKEASRMFFETLVLKSRDYIHVEQSKPHENINIKPRMKLMKSDF